ncbi:MAG: hypothetical protein AB1757_31200, partial [Acidobacteriota bacterium]
MRIYNKLLSLLVIGTLLAATTLAQQPQKSSSVTPKAATTTVIGSGTTGQLPKWIGSDGVSFMIGNSNIFEDKFGKVGIGTTAPTSPLTVQGMIETTLGGYKFPDGTVQTTALSTGQVVSRLNGLKGDVTLIAGTNITITPSGNTLTIDAPNALSTIEHNATLAGNGTAASPLRIAVPLTLTGPNTVLQIESTVANGSTSRAINVKGGNNATSFGGAGIWSTGGDSSAANRGGGSGVVGTGGTGSNMNDGGRGVEGVGGDASGAGSESGDGIVGFPGEATNGATVGKAGRFLGSVEVLGTLSKAGGSFKIDHPLDPENKYLSHSFVESPDMMNIYNGNITTDVNGRAVV